MRKLLKLAKKSGTGSLVAHLHVQDLLQPVHDDQRGLLHGRVAVLGAVLYNLHQGLVGGRAQVVLVAVGSAGEGTGGTKGSEVNSKAEDVCVFTAVKKLLHSAKESGLFAERRPGVRGQTGPGHGQPPTCRWSPAASAR